jgi:hypothetical protein
MSFLTGRRRSPQNRAAAPIEAVENPATRRNGFVSRLLGPSPAVRQSKEVSRHHRREPVVGGTRTRRRGFGNRRSKKTNPVANIVDTVRPQRHHVTFGERLQGFGKKIEGALTGRPAKTGAGTRMMAGTDSAGRGPHRRRRFF